ncbi:Cna B-type domain-containing protein [Candidatus Saccharibacteria bacterium]|nr:Cna B-type domain-containing protein [Candidatus Saccharibacteria bacterium]
MSVKRKIFNIFAAVLIAFGSVPTAFLNTFAEETTNPAGDAPKSSKTVTANGDGTYDVKIEIEGVSSEQDEATKANVVVVLDTSGSMDTPSVMTASSTGRYGMVNGDYSNLYRQSGLRCVRITNDTTTGTVYSDNSCDSRYTGTRYVGSGSTRLQVAKDAINDLADQLLSQNDPSNEVFKDVVEMSFIDFSSSIKANTTHNTASNNAPTTNVNTFQNWVDATSATGGTNWETALSAANSTSFGTGDNDKTYIIFVSDGNPTYRDSAYVSRPGDCSGNSCPPSPYGTGYSDPNSYNLNAAIDVADVITAEGSNKELYTIGAFGSVSNMQSLGGNYYSASNQTALEEAFAEIVDKISKGLSVADLQITDGITAATSMPVSGTAGAFRYEVPDDWETAGYEPATFDGSAVHWNPGHHNTLSNGQKASVTFTVWPSQEALDCIATIKNGGTCDKDLSAFGLEVVVDEYNNVNYYLQTNTTASFTYRTATKIQGSDEVVYSDASEPVTIKLTRNVPPLPETLLSVTKVWADSMDPKQRNDLSKVTLDFYVDDVKVNTYEFTGNAEGSEWINANGTTDGYTYAVAPGVMKKLAGLSSDEATTLRNIANTTGGGVVTVNGVEYAILEKGHTYRFEEFYTLTTPTSTNHYKITKKVYHPMIVDDGFIHDVEFSEDGSAAVIDSNKLTKLSAENTLNGGIKVFKKVINNDVEDTSVNDDYTITINVSEETGLYRILHADGTRTDDIAFENGTITVTIKQTDQILVKDLLDGTTFSVSETLPDGYDRNKVEYELIDYNNNQSSTTGSAAQVVHGNMSSTATITNYLSSGDLIISKTVKVDSGNEEKAQGQKFGFTVYFYENEDDEEPVRVDNTTCNLSKNEDGEDIDNRISHEGTCTIENIPKGWHYKIVEEAKAGFNEGEETIKEGTIKQGNNKEEFENTYKVNSLKTDIFAKKGFTNNIFWLPSDNFTFQMKYNDAVKDSAVVNLDKDTATFEVEITDEGEFEYTIAELEEGFRTGVSRVSGDKNVVWTIVTEDNGEGDLILKSKTVSKDDDDQTDNQTIYNQYVGTTTYGKNKELEFEKDLQGRDWNDDDEFTFAISSTDSDAPMPKDANGRTVTSLIVDKDHKKVNFGTITFDQSFVNNKVYHYTVTETFDSSAIQSVVQSDDTKDGISFTIKVEYTREGELSLVVSDYENTFVNIYETKNITAKKIWSDDSDRDGLRADYDLYVAVKDGDEYVAYKAIDVSGTSNEENFTFEDLPLFRDDADEEIEYTVVEATGCATSDSGVITCEKEFENNESDGVYSVSYSNGNTITNAHTPETKTITIKKTWDVPESGLPSTQPAFILVDLTNDENNEKKAVRLEGNDYGEWTSDPITVLTYKNHGEDITYEVKETGINGENNLTGDNKDTLYIYNGEILEGKWVAESVEDSFEVKNTWTAATNVYGGSTKFYIKKVDDKDRAMSDVKFTVDGKEYTTNAKGIIEIKVAEDTETAEDDLTFAIKETETQEGYDLVSGTENLNVTSTSSFDRADVNEMKNYYTKTYSFDPTEINGYVWNDNMYIVTNNRSKANSLKIEKTFSGVSKNALKDLTFTVTGPNDFGDEGEMTINFEDCDISGNKATCEVDADIFTGNYTVVENNAEVKYFDLTTSGDNNATKKVSSGSDVVFKITNKYVAKTTSYTITKVWDDNHDQDGKRPGSLTVNLKADGKTVETEQLSDNYEGDEENIWTITWDNLPIANEDGDEIGYLGEEELKSDDYDLTNTEEGDSSITFTNTHEPELINKTGEIKVTKIWEDGNNKLGVRPGSIYVVLLADGEEFDAATFGENKDGEWVFIFEDLYKYSGGHEIEYSVEEGKLSNDYSTKIEGNATDGFVITNRSTNPCAFGGCGGTTPNTGHFTKNTGSATAEDGIMNVWIGGAMAVLLFGFGFVSRSVKRKK